MNHYLNKPVREIMTKEVVTVEPQAVMTSVAQIFETATFHHVPVVKDKEPIGIISKHDFNLLLGSRTLFKMENYDKINKRWLSALTASDVMSKDPVCMHPDDLIANALEAFLINRYHAILICEYKELVGILTPFDILRMFKNASSV
jgi:acetoin utilization protein AcuB